MKNKWLWGNNSVNIPGRIMDILILPSIYKPSFISISFVLFKTWPGQATLMKNDTSSFKVICWTRYPTDGRTERQSGDYMLSPLAYANYV